MNKVLWKPTPQSIERSNLIRYMKWLAEHRHLHFETYDQLWQWSIDHIDDFWQSLWTYFDIMSDGFFENVRSGNEMPGIISKRIIQRLFMPVRKDPSKRFHGAASEKTLLHFKAS